MVPESKPLEERYVDDGTVTVDDRKKFSLRSGATSAALPVRAATVPGDRMSDDEVLDEIGGGKRVVIIGVVGAAAVALIAVVWLAVGSKKNSAVSPPAGSVVGESLPRAAALNAAAAQAPASPAAPPSPAGSAAAPTPVREGTTAAAASAGGARAEATPGAETAVAEPTPRAAVHKKAAPAKKKTVVARHSSAAASKHR